MSNIVIITTAAQDVATLLASLGYGTIGTDLFVWKEPDDENTKDNITTIYDSGDWLRPELGYSYEYPSVQIRIRWSAGNNRAAKARLLAIKNALHGYVGTIGTIQYHLVRASFGDTFLGEDDRGRPRWSFNCEIQRSL